MSLTTEWRVRIENWKQELMNVVYLPLGPLHFRNYVTKEFLTARQAGKQEFKPVLPGTRWGNKWEYGWFKANVTLPKQAAHKRIALNILVGGETLCYVNGKAVGSTSDKRGSHIEVSEKGTAGQTFNVLVEAYAWHGARVARAGHFTPGRETVPEVRAPQKTLQQSTFGIWEEELYQLYIDVETLFGLRNSLDENSLRVSEIDQALCDFTTIVDLELPREEMLKTIPAARKRLRPLLLCKNGTTAPIMYAFGHAHLDVAWLWPLAETERKAARTLANQLALIKMYPDYKFLHSQAHLFMMVKTKYPGLYQRVKKAVAQGRIIPEGGMWVEADTNLSGGESLIRQFIHGKRFFKNEFGKNSVLLWLPDVFGYSGALPQVMKKCGINYFSTAKIFWNYNGGDIFPHNTFMWEGIDGSQVLVHLTNNYNSHTNPAEVIDRWNQRVQKNGIATRLLPFGHGDGGGGPSRHHLEFLKRERNLEGVPLMKSASPVDYFKDQEARGIPNVKYVGELYFQAHRGTFTSQAKTKKGNRKSEYALREAELWASVASQTGGYRIPYDKLHAAWQQVLLQQFHDIIPGSSIERVYEEAEKGYAQVLETAREIADQAAAALLKKSGSAITVFNSLSWPRTEMVALPPFFNGKAHRDNIPLPAQSIDGVWYAQVNLPACGSITLNASRERGTVHPVVSASSRGMENDLLRIGINATGEITGIYDKETKKEWAQGPCNSFKMYKDVPAAWDAWDIDSTYAFNPVALNEPVNIKVLAKGPLVGIVRVTRKINHSVLRQDIIMKAGSRRIDFKTWVDWKESHKLLKVNFPVAVHAHEAIHEIQFGHIKRPNHASRPFDADRFEVCNHKWTALAEEKCGCAILNDCKYGVNVVDNSINLTLLKSALAPDMHADKGIQEFTYAFYAWNTSFMDCDVVEQAYNLNVPVLAAAGKRTPEGGSLFAVDAANIILETVKPAEDRSGDMVLRLYEAKRTSTRCRLKILLPVKRAALTSMLEEKEAEIKCANGILNLAFKPFEVKTIRLQF